MVRQFGYLPSRPDKRDYTLGMFVQGTIPLPDTFMRPYIPPVYDQGIYGMCNAFALASLKEMQENEERGYPTRWSPGFIYGNDLWGWMEGMVMRDSLEYMCKYGVCTFEELPIIATKPECSAALNALYSPAFVEKAKEQRTKSYLRLNTVEEIKTALVTLGPVLVGYILRNSFNSVGSDGMVPAPVADEALIGGHAMLFVGYTRTHFVTLNSYGKNWGKAGIGFIPFEYMPQEAWTVADMKPASWKMELWLGKKEYTVNGVKKLMDTAPIIGEGNRILVPIRAVSEEQKLEVAWDQTTKKVTLTKY